MALATRGAYPVPPTSGQEPVSPTRKLAQASETTSSTRGQTAGTRRTTILQPVEWKLQSQKVRQNETGEEMSQMKEQDIKLQNNNKVKGQ